MPPYSQETHESWEDSLLQEVKRTVKEVWAEAGRPRRVLLAVDGVVPMAKIRQQRVRRFKSAWLSASDAEDSWDKNAITPGTEFMDVKLTRALTSLVEDHRGWELSSVHEPGEGEHKVMRWIREGGASGLRNIVVYGLDADLILLSMITMAQTGVSISLLREKQEFGGVSTGPTGEQEYQMLVLEELVKRIGIPSTDLAGILNYVALMSLMGNDFLPHSLTHSLNEDGHDCVLAALRAGRTVVRAGEGGHWQIDRSAVLELLAEWSHEEESRIVHTIKKKREQAVRGVGKGMEQREGYPLEWNVEEAILPTRGGGGRLIEDWREVTWDLWIHPGSAGREEIRHELCESYLFGCQWILDYYTGQKDVDLLWMFPSWLPPFWSDFARCERSVSAGVAPNPSKPLQPAEQLAMVLPLSSWGLIRDRAMRRLPASCPQMWPTRFGFLSVGRKWLWQCEALVPVLTAERLRAELAASQ
jgi:5'-3' exonuclease